MRTLALLGGAETTRGQVWTSQAEEIWTMNWNYLYEWVPRIDRLFEMHPVWLYARTEKKEYVKPRRHWKWLHEPRDYPADMLQEIPAIPRCVRYPIEQVTAALFGEALQRDGQLFDLFTSSFDYMLALAIYEGWDVIELYGLEMGSDTEYRYQREGAAFWIGQAVARGIKVKLPRGSVLLRQKKYGYEGGQMIFRQDIERMLQKVQEKKRDALARLQHVEGQMAAVQAQNGELAELEAKRQEYRDDALVASAGEQMLIFQLREIDLEEVELELVNPLRQISSDLAG